MSQQSDLVAAKVVGDNYHFRGKPIPKGRIVRVQKSALEAAQNTKPAYLVAASAAEAKAAGIAELPDYEAPAEEAPKRAK